MNEIRIPHIAGTEATRTGRAYDTLTCRECGQEVTVETDGRGRLVEYVRGGRHGCPPPDVNGEVIHEATAMSLRIMQARERAGINQVDCAMQAGIGHTRMGQIERGAREPTMEEIRALEWVLGGLTTDKGR